MRQVRTKAACVVACLVASAFAAWQGDWFGAVALAAHARTPASQALDVLPFPDTPDAPPGTSVIFPAVSAAQIASVRVVGSRTGFHSGHLSAQPAGHGTAFYPRQPFSPGERVTVSAVLRSTAAAAASGSRSRRFSFSFGVARVMGDGKTEAPKGYPADVITASPTTSARGGTRSFVTEPHWHVPVVTMSGRDPDPKQGDIFLDAQNTGHPGPYILNPKGDLLYYNPAPKSVFNAHVQRYNGRPVLTYWQGAVVGPGVGRAGKDMIVDQRYKTVHVVTAGAGWQKRGTDLHEFTLGHEGHEATAFVTIAAPVQYNLTSVGGPPNGIVYDWIIQELDIKTNKVIWEWQSLHHIPLSWSYTHPSAGQNYDYFHLNSIQQLPNGRLIISARHTFAVYAIDKRTGHVVWELGGKHSNFRMGPGTRFSWQHHATLHNNGLITIFDDHNGRASRGLALRINLSSHQATLVRAFYHKPDAFYSLSQGSTQILADHNVFVGWGSSSHFTEFGPGGGQKFSGSFRGRVQSYRAYRFSDWIGNPMQPPAIAIRKAKTPRHVLLFVSWNGATRVRHWRLLGSSSKTGPFKKARSTVPWTSFETKIFVAKSAGPYFRVQALDGNRRVLANGTSPVISLP
jgi:hypothetical protein